MSAQGSPIVRRWRLTGVGFGGVVEVRRIEIVFSGNPDQGEQGVAPRICEKRISGSSRRCDRIPRRFWR
jgi:hypothetical protein